MIQERTKLKVADNSGAKTVRCFRVLGGTNRKYAEIGDLIIASVQSARPRQEVQKGDVVRAVVVRQTKPYRRPDGSYVKFEDNAVVLIEKNQPIGTRIFGPIPRDIKDEFGDIVSMAEDVV